MSIARWFSMLSLLIAALPLWGGQQELLMPTKPGLSPDGGQLVFSWRGDIWLVSSGGGKARPLTTLDSIDGNPCFSPDGKQVLFRSNRDDSQQLYMYNLETGDTRKLTSQTEGYDPIEVYADGKSALCRFTRDQGGLSSFRLAKVSLNGTSQEELIFDDYATSGSVSRDGTKVLFTREGVERYRKGYHGSKASQIWLYDTKKKTFQPVMREEYEVREPVWHPDGRHFYYLNGRTGIANVHLRDLETGEDRVLTQFTDSPVIAPTVSADGSTMVFQQLFHLYRLDLKSKNAKAQKLTIEAEAGTPQFTKKRRWYDKVWNNDFPGTVDFTRDGLQIALTSGGDLFVMDTIMREPVAVTSGTLDHDREACFSPDGQTIYFLRDNGKSVNIWKARRKNLALTWWENREFLVTPITSDDKNRYNLSISPDGKMLGWVENRGNVMAADLDYKTVHTVMTSPYAGTEYDWAPDGKWLVCTLQDSDQNFDVWIAAVDGKRKPFNLSRHPNADYGARWSNDGNVIAYVGRRYDNTVSIFYVYLQKEEEKNDAYIRKLEHARQPFRVPAKPAEAKPGEAAKPEVKPAETKPVVPAKPPVVYDNPEVTVAEGGTVKIEFEDLETRIRTIPVDGNNPGNLFWSPDGKILAFTATVGGQNGTWKVIFPDQLKPVQLSKTMGIHANWHPGDKIAWVVDGIPAIGDQRYPFQAYQETDLEEYNRLAFRLIWRALRDNFYDPRMKGVDWNAVLDRYENMAAKVPDMAAFDTLVDMLHGELNASHLGFTPTATPRAPFNNWVVQTAHLGLLFDPAHHGEGLMVRKVVRNGPTDKAPNFVRSGELVLSIDGTPVNPDTDLTKLLNQRPDWVFKIRIRDIDGKDRDIYVPAITYGRIRELLLEERIYNNRQTVNQLSNKRIGYLNIEHMNMPSLRQFEHDVYATTFDRDGLIIDVRNNPGGFTSDFLLAILCHPQHAITIPRDGDRSYPSGYLGKVTYNKPLVVLCNQNSCSNAEIFSHAIKSLKRGKLVGVPTQGAVISTPDTKILDIGVERIPDRGWWAMDGIDMEMRGAIPDVVVWPEPGEIPAGIDRQLEKATEIILKDVEDAAKKNGTRLIWARDGYGVLPAATATKPEPAKPTSSGEKSTLE
jgi:tricorn protease